MGFFESKNYFDRKYTTFRITYSVQEINYEL